MLSRALMLWSVRRIGVFQVEKPARHPFRQKSESSGVPEKRGSAEDKANNQREKAV
jgi:hypothetical protein